MSQRDGRTERRYETARRRRTGLKAIRGVFIQQYGSRREPGDIASWWYRLNFAVYAAMDHEAARYRLEGEPLCAERWPWR